MLELIDKLKLKQTFKGRKRVGKTWDDSKALAELIANDKSTGKFKHLVRDGVPDDMRGHVWSLVLGINDLPDYERDYEQAVKNAGIDRMRAVTDTYPTFGGILNPEKFALTADGIAVVKNILRIMARDYPHLEYCPFLPTIVALLLHHFSPDDTLASTRQLVTQSMKCAEIDSWKFFPTNFKGTVVFYNAFGDLLQKYVPKVCRHMKTLDEGMEENKFWIKWLNNFCTDILVTPTVFRLVDTFLTEGYKVIIRFCIGAILLRQNVILSATDTAQVDALFENQPLGSLQDQEDLLVKTAFGISISRSDVSRFASIQRNSMKDMGSQEKMDAYAQAKILPNLHSKSNFITDEHWAYVWTWIPKRFKSLDLELIFSTDRHGYNLKTMYSQCAYKEPQMLIVETTAGEVLGAYLSDSWEDHIGRRSFGTAETFLFSLVKGKEKKYEWIGFNVKPDETERQKDINENASLFIFGDMKMMAVGGGGLRFGLSLDETLSKGTTGTCFTFNNKELTSGAQSFDVRHVEVWSFK